MKPISSNERVQLLDVLRGLAIFGTLTNYLFTGLVAAFISFSWGLGLYGKISVWQGLLLVLMIFPIQMLASQWWMARYNFGPVEWLWRSFTYGKLQPMDRIKVRYDK